MIFNARRIVPGPLRTLIVIPGLVPGTHLSAAGVEQNGIDP